MSLSQKSDHKDDMTTIPEVSLPFLSNNARCFFDFSMDNGRPAGQSVRALSPSERGLALARDDQAIQGSHFRSFSGKTCESTSQTNREKTALLTSIRHPLICSLFGSTTSHPASLCGACSMPSADSHKKVSKVACNIENVYREWKANPAVRKVIIARDRMFESWKGPSDGVKFGIKDAVHNRFVLIPLLEKLSVTPGLKLPSVKSLAREILGFLFQKMFIHSSPRLTWNW